jgi:hypothetical protein
MSGGFVVAGFAGAGLASDLSGVVGMVKIFSGTCVDQPDAASFMILTIVSSTSCAARSID